MAGARLLIVDDEASLRDLLRRYLERSGYVVEAFADSEEALRRFEAEPERFSLVVTDLALPGLNGEELIGRMRALNPQLRALILSGYPHVPTQPLTGFLQKPFLPKTLIEEIERALAK
ncbi:MAG TPA: response regulator [Bryobacteraceae bacterium]|nr:response regulator [Bryobacteraceae bacterium]